MNTSAYVYICTSHPVLHFIVSLKVFSHQFDRMDLMQQHLVLKDFVLRFLSHSGTRCTVRLSFFQICEHMLLFTYISLSS